MQIRFLSRVPMAQPLFQGEQKVKLDTMAQRDEVKFSGETKKQRTEKEEEEYINSLSDEETSRSEEEVNEFYEDFFVKIAPEHKGVNLKKIFKDENPALSDEEIDEKVAALTPEQQEKILKQHIRNIKKPSERTRYILSKLLREIFDGGE